MNSVDSIGERLKTQDNRATMHPMFCVQIKRRDVGYDSAYSDNRCWRDSANEETIYDDDKDFKGEPEGDQWEEFGYVDRWETVMVAFTEEGCKEYLELNGHNDRRRAHNGEVQIYAESFYRCPEMIAIREFLMSGEHAALLAVVQEASKLAPMLPVVDDIICGPAEDLKDALAALEAIRQKGQS